MSMELLDKNGLTYFWGKIKSYVAGLLSSKADDSGVVHLTGDESVTGTKTFVGSKKVAFKQSANNDKLGFTLFSNSNVEKGYLEYNPTNQISGVPLMTLGNYATAAAGLSYVGFRKYSSISGANGAYNLLTPLISDAKAPFNLTTTYTNFFLPLGVTNGDAVVTTASSGMLDISPLLTPPATAYSASRSADIAVDGTFTVPSYTVGKGQILVYLDGCLSRQGDGWDEVGTAGDASTTIKFNQLIPAGMEIVVRVN